MLHSHIVIFSYIGLAVRFLSKLYGWVEDTILAVCAWFVCAFLAADLHITFNILRGSEQLLACPISKRKANIFRIKLKGKPNNRTVIRFLIIFIFFFGTIKLYEAAILLVKDAINDKNSSRFSGLAYHSADIFINLNAIVIFKYVC